MYSLEMLADISAVSLIDEKQGCQWKDSVESLLTIVFRGFQKLLLISLL